MGFGHEKFSVRINTLHNATFDCATSRSRYLIKICSKQPKRLHLHHKWHHREVKWYLTIIGRGWAKDRDLSVRLRQIIDLRDTDKSRSFATTEFNHCLIIRSPSCFCNEYLREAKRSAIFTQGGSQEGEKRGLIYAWAEYYCSQTKLDDIRREETIICRQLFAGHVVCSRPMKRTKNVQQMITPFLMYFSVMNVYIFFRWIVATMLNGRLSICWM